MEKCQPGILAPTPKAARYLAFNLMPGVDPRKALQSLAAETNGDVLVVGLGASVVSALGATINALGQFPSYATRGCTVPSIPVGLWCWLRGSDRGELLHRARKLESLLSPTFALESMMEAFTYDGGKDLTGYIDGTENPQGSAALDAALMTDGSSIVAVQQWQHNLSMFEARSQVDQDHIIGRRKSDNEELDDAPPSAHVKRTAQESFSPEAFMLRRSMPWVEGPRSGLMFVAFAKDTYAFDVQMRRMVGEDDGIVDGLFQFSKPLGGAYFWCPPIKGGQLDLSLLGM